MARVLSAANGGSIPTENSVPMRVLRWTTDSGILTLTYPGAMGVEDARDAVAVVGLAMRGIMRTMDMRPDFSGYASVMDDALLDRPHPEEQT